MAKKVGCPEKLRNKRTGKCNYIFAKIDNPIGSGKKIILVSYSEYKNMRKRARREGFV